MSPAMDYWDEEDEWYNDKHVSGARHVRPPRHNSANHTQYRSVQHDNSVLVAQNLDDDDEYVFSDTRHGRSPQYNSGHRDTSAPNVKIHEANADDNRHYTIGDAELAESEMSRVFESQEARYWTSTERHRALNTNWIIVHSIIIAMYKITDDLRAWIRLYGPAGAAAVATFGKKSVWEAKVKVLADPKPPPALKFKKVIEDESGRIGISGAIVAQAAFTALSLSNMDQTHWTARAACIFSLVSALLAVYYAGRQVWTMACLSDADEIKAWIRGGKKGTEHVLNNQISPDHQIHFKSILESLVPAPSSVLTVSAPRLLLSAALKFLLIGLGIHLGFLWTRNLDVSTRPNDSRNVFVVYLVSLVFCYGVYTLSDLDQDIKTSTTVRRTFSRSLHKFGARLVESKPRQWGRSAKGKDKVEGGSEEQEDELAEHRERRTRTEEGEADVQARMTGRGGAAKAEDGEVETETRSTTRELSKAAKTRVGAEEGETESERHRQWLGDFALKLRPEHPVRPRERRKDRKLRKEQEQQEQHRRELGQTQQEPETQRVGSSRSQLEKEQERQVPQEPERQILEARPERENPEQALVKWKQPPFPKS